MLTRYFGSADLDAVTPEMLEIGQERLRVDFGLETDAPRRFGLWTLLYMLGDAPDLDVAFDDLNQDGQDEAIVLLKGQDWCGSGGCTMLIFQGKSNHQFDFLSKTTLVDTPVYSTTYLHNGWKQVLVYSRKHGQVMLKFDGTQYPLNPSLLPVATAKLAPNTAKLLLGVAE